MATIEEQRKEAVEKLNHQAAELTVEARSYEWMARVLEETESPSNASRTHVLRVVKGLRIQSKNLLIEADKATRDAAAKAETLGQHRGASLNATVDKIEAQGNAAVQEQLLEKMAEVTAGE